MIVVAVGTGAGLVSALLFAVVITGSPLGILLSYVAPVPVLIAALGWNHRAGLIATLVGAIATALVFRFEAGIAFALGSALPGWWLAYLALLGRPAAGLDRPAAGPERPAARPERPPDGLGPPGAAGAVEWYPLGSLLVWVALIAAFVTLAGVFALGSGSHDSYRETLRQAIGSVLRFKAPDPSEDGSASPDALIDALVAAVPFLASSIFALVYTLNLWLAAKAVAISGRLPRPWPDIPGTAMPRLTLGLLAGAVLAGFGPGLVGVAGLSLAGALVMAFALQGLALLHDRLRGQPLRLPLLAGTYLLIAFSQGVLLCVPMLVGLVDTAVRMPRSGPGGAGPQLPSV